MDVSDKNKWNKNYWPSEATLMLTIDKVSGDYGFIVKGKRPRYVQKYGNNDFIKDNELYFVVYMENRVEGCEIQVLNRERVAEREFLERCVNSPEVARGENT
jgi:hypothetical protein